jgi:endonuclease-3
MRSTDRAKGKRHEETPAEVPVPEEQARVREIVERLRERYPVARTALKFRTPLELLVATILSAQCTDERVNQVTAELFRRYRTAEEYASAPLRELERLIRPTGYYRNKARAIKAACQKLVADFGGEVPATMEALLTLPGVARKTANVVLQNAFGIASGIVVDTHVLRVAQRLGLTREKDRDKVERDLMALVPREEWIAFSHRLIAHGRETCRARRPLCGQCSLESLCPYPQKVR